MMFAFYFQVTIWLNTWKGGGTVFALSLSVTGRAIAEFLLGRVVLVRAEQKPLNWKCLCYLNFYVPHGNYCGDFFFCDIAIMIYDVMKPSLYLVSLQPREEGGSAKPCWGDEGLLLTVPPLRTIEMLSQQQAYAKPEIPPKASTAPVPGSWTRAWDVGHTSLGPCCWGGLNLPPCCPPRAAEALQFPSYKRRGMFWGGRSCHPQLGSLCWPSLGWAQAVMPLRGSSGSY